jgi:hypothetical protein
MTNNEKMFFTLDEVMERFNLTLSALSKKLILYNVEVRKLPGSNKEYIATSDVMLLEQAIKDPGSIL